MNIQSTILSRLAIISLAAITLTATSIAGPGPMPMYTMVGGKMYMLTPLKKDAKGTNGCTVCTSGSVTMPGKKAMMLKNGEVVTSEGTLMTPAALKAHGG